jgi:CRISPR-associated DxTHG motif protein
LIRLTGMYGSRSFNMSKVYLSFVGLGSDRKKSGIFEYDKAVYELNGQQSGETEFVQVAELQILGANRFAQVIIIATQKSYDAHFDNLKIQLTAVGVGSLSHIIISEDMSPSGQWAWFEKILSRINSGDALTIDLTHGYRSIPIVFSTAINFLQKARGITIDGVYYGAYDANRKLSPIVDMKDFYLINEWADGVSRLVEDADARKIAKTAEQTPQFQAGELNNDEVISAFEDLTNAIRNVDVNNVAEKANRTIALLRKKEENASATGRILLNLVMDKFASLMTKAPPSGKYDAPYFRMQLEIIKLLLEHRLFMQAYTVMREFIASLGLVGVEKAAVATSKGRRKRGRFGEVFVCMLQFAESKWKFSEQAQKDVETLRPYYAGLKDLGVEAILRSFARDLTDYRNGFDHAWTLRSEAKGDVEKKGRIFYGKLKEVIEKLENSHLL